MTVDHIIPLSERADLVHDELNCRVLCRPCNAARGDRCADPERQQVLDAIAKRKQRLAEDHPTIVNCRLERLGEELWAQIAGSCKDDAH